MQQSQWNAYNYHIRFEWDDPTLQPFVESVVMPNWQPSEALRPDAEFTLLSLPDGRVSLSHNDISPTNCYHKNLALELQRKCHLDLATNAPNLVFVHSGVVAIGNGLLVLPGRSYSGKSTLVRSLIDRGA